MCNFTVNIILQLIVVAKHFIEKCVYERKQDARRNDDIFIFFFLRNILNQNVLAWIVNFKTNKTIKQKCSTRIEGRALPYIWIVFLRHQLCLFWSLIDFNCHFICLFFWFILFLLFIWAIHFIVALNKNSRINTMFASITTYQVMHTFICNKKKFNRLP